MLRGKLYAGLEKMDEIRPIREAVFVDEQGWDASSVYDDMDTIAIHAVIYADDMPIASGRIYCVGGEFHCGRVCVLREYRGIGAGELTVRLLVYKAFEAGAQEVLIHSQEHAAPFYERIGFVRVGETDNSLRIPHVHMRLTKEAFDRPCHGMV